MAKKGHEKDQFRILMSTFCARSMQVIHIWVLKGAKGQISMFSSHGRKPCDPFDTSLSSGHIDGGVISPQCRECKTGPFCSSQNLLLNLSISACKYIVHNPLLQVPPHPSPIHVCTILRSGNTCHTWKLGFRLFRVWGTCVAICVVGFWLGWTRDLNHLLFRARWRFATQHLPKRFRVSRFD